MGAVHLLDLQRRHLLAAGLDDVDRRPSEHPVAVELADGDVTGMEPSVGERFGGCVWSAPVLAEHVGAAHEKLARCAVGHVGAGIVHEAHFDAR